MAFKSEIHVAELASIRTGHTEGDIYYILDNGMLDDLPCKPGTFVKWHNDAWQILPNEHYALASAIDGDIAKAIDNALDDGSASKTIAVVVPSSQSGNYTVGYYYEVQGKVARLRAKTEGDNVTHLTFDTTSGILEAINSGSGKIAVFECTYNQDVQGYVYPTTDELNDARVTGKLPVIVEISPVGGRTYYVATQMTWYMNTVKFRFVDTETGKMLKLEGPTSKPVWSVGSAQGITKFSDKTESDLVDNTLTIGGGNSFTKLTLTTVQTLTVLANVDVPNFALEIDNTGNSNDVIVVVKDSTGTTTLNASAAGGDTVVAGKYMQLTCVGSCWTLAEFAVPTP